MRPRAALLLLLCASGAPLACGDLGSRIPKHIVPFASLTALPSGVTFHVLPGDVAIAPKTVTLRNSGTETINWRATVPASWMSLDTTSGTLSSGQSAVLTITVNRTLLPTPPQAGVITVRDGSFPEVNADIDVTVLPRPTLISVTPSFGPVAGGTAVTLTGTGFQKNAAGTNTVTFANLAATSVVTVNDTTITCVVPAGPAPGLVEVKVSNNNGIAVLVEGYQYLGDLSPPELFPQPFAGEGQVTLTWNAVPGATSYTVYYATAPGVTTAATKIEGLRATVTMISGLGNGTTYYFRVTARNPITESALSNEALGTPQDAEQPPGPTLNVTATAGNGEVTVSWSPVVGAATYNLYYSTTSGFAKAAGTALNSVALPTTVTGLTNGTPYYFLVSAVNSKGEGPVSAQATATPTGLAVPAAPNPVTAAPGDGEATVTWTAVSGAITYNLYFSATPSFALPSGTKISAVTPTSTKVKGLVNGTKYYFRITAANGVGESMPSNEVNATPGGPGPPGQVLGLTATPGDGQVVLNWTLVAGATAYQVYFTDTPPVTTASTGYMKGRAGPPVTVQGRVNGVSYQFMVIATNAFGNGPPSTVATAVPVADPCPECTPKANVGIGFVHVAAGYQHCLAVGSNGTVWAWGRADQGALGMSTTNQNRPVQVTGPAGFQNIKQVAAGSQYSHALAADGTVWSWGGNAAGQLGIGSFTATSTPTQIAGLTGVVQIAASSLMQSSLAVLADGTVRGWGSNAFGQLGDGSTTTRTSPVAVLGLTDVAAVSCSGVHSLALRRDGTVFAWGINTGGQFGNGTTNNSLVPIAIGTFSNIAAISAGNNGFSLALRSDGTVLGCGNNGPGQLGDGTSIARLTPVTAIGLTNVFSISAGFAFSFGVRADGTIWAWGDNLLGELGVGGGANFRLVPTQVVNMTAGLMVASGSENNVALKADGTAWAWGRGTSGELGNGSFTDSNVPVAVIMP